MATKAILNEMPINYAVTDSLFVQFSHTRVSLIQLQVEWEIKESLKVEAFTLIDSHIGYIFNEDTDPQYIMILMIWGILVTKFPSSIHPHNYINCKAKYRSDRRVESTLMYDIY